MSDAVPAPQATGEQGPGKGPVEADRALRELRGSQELRRAGVQRLPGEALQAPWALAGQVKETG